MKWMHRGIPSLAVALILGTALFSSPAQAAAPSLCATAQSPDCGAEAGDASCGEGFDCVPAVPCGQNEACIPTECECRPRVCCKCESLEGGVCDQLQCQDTVLADVFACVAPCLALDFFSVDTCNLKIVNQATCSGDDCATEGCCGFATAEPPSNAMQGSQAQAQPPAAVNACSLTDSATCGLLGGTFVAGGSCSTGLVGACVSPTPTATATQTATATATATQTATGTASQTPTRTRGADGADCATPSDCNSGFCVDGVCCDTACDGPQQVCDAASERGTCVDAVAPAPALSRSGLLIGLLLMALVGGLAFWRRRLHAG